MSATMKMKADREQGRQGRRDRKEKERVGKTLIW